MKKLWGLLIITLFCGGAVAVSEVIQTEKLRPPPTVLIDAGHGGFDGGAVASDGTLEKDLALDIALLLKVELELSNVKVLMTRIEDVGLHTTEEGRIRVKKNEDLRNRKRMITESGADAVISVHINKFTNAKQRGTQVFYAKNGNDSEELAKTIIAKLEQDFPESNPRIPLVVPKTVHIMQNLNMPACILECGFLSNSQDLAQLKDMNYKVNFAKHAASAIRQYLMSGSRLQNTSAVAD